jgi:hypothetical protein
MSRELKPALAQVTPVGVVLMKNESLGWSGHSRRSRAVATTLPGYGLADVADAPAAWDMCVATGAPLLGIHVPTSTGQSCADVDMPRAACPPSDVRI